MIGYQNLNHTRWDADDGSRPRGENQLARLLQPTIWQSVSLDRPTAVQRCSFDRPIMAGLPPITDRCKSLHRDRSRLCFKRPLL
jgi:hypothetical protein